MGYRMDLKDADRMPAKFQEGHEIWASKRFVGRDRYSDTDLIKYARVDRAEEIEYREKSDFPAKGMLSPTTQSLFYFTEDEFIESKAVSKKLLIFMRPCDIRAQHHQEKVYLTNGGYEGIYHKRMDEKVKIVMMEYGEDWGTCFYVSMGANRTGDYSTAVRFGENVSELQTKDDAFASYFEGMKECPSEPRFMEKNKLTLMVPEVPSREVLTKLREHPMWRQSDGRCISYGARTVTCSIRTRFTTTDTIYNENRDMRERKRIPASCQVKDFTDVAGGTSFRNRTEDRMRHKVLRKFHNHKIRFKNYHMCVGCGWYMDQCPGYMSIMATVNKMADAVAEMKVGGQAQERE